MFRPSLLLLVAPLAFAGCGFGDTNDADGSAPAIQITKPDGTVHDVVDFAALVVDDRGVQVVEFYVNDVLIGTDFTDPYEVKWNTLTVPDGTTVLKVVARDFSANQAFISKNVTVANGPN